MTAPDAPEPRWRVYVAALAATLMWSFAFHAIERLNREESVSGIAITPADSVMFRYLPTVILFAIGLTVRREWGEGLRFLRMSWPQALVLGFLTVPAYQWCLSYGEAQVAPGLAALIVATTPILTILLAAPALGETITPRKGLGALLAFLGVALAVHGGVSEWTRGSALAVGVTFLSALSWALYTLISKRVLAGMGPFVFTAFACILGTLLWVPFTPPAFWGNLAHYSPGAWAAGLFLGAGCSFVAYTLWSYGTKHLEAGQIVVFANVFPLLSNAADVATGRTRATIGLGVAVLLVVGGVLLVNLRPRARRAARLALLREHPRG